MRLVAIGLMSLGLLLSPAAASAQKLFADSRMVETPRFSVEVVGKGPDLVLIPGLASSRETWRATAERLRGRYRLHLIQIAGFAGEPVRANAAGEVLVPTAEAIDAYLVAEKLAPATVIGHSLGGTTVLYLAQKHPDHLKRGMMVDAYPFGGLTMGLLTPEQAQPVVAMIRKAPPQTSRAEIASQIGSMATGPADQAKIVDWRMASDNDAVTRAYLEIILLDLRPGLATTKTPLTIVYPDNVSLGMPAGQIALYYRNSYAAAAGVTLKEVAGSRHFVMFDQPQAFADALDAFLAN